MKFFAKHAASVTPINKPQASAGNTGQGVISRTTPAKKHKRRDNPSTTHQQPKPTKTDLKEVTASLREDWNNLKYVTKHKAYIIGPGRELGLGYGQLLAHDMSKFRPSEWNPYKKYFCGERTPEVTKNFRNAVETSHYKRNPHHRQNAEHAQKKFQLEEVVDWYAASKAQSSSPSRHPSFKQWYLQRRDYFLQHPIKPVDPFVDQHIINKIM